MRRQRCPRCGGPVLAGPDRPADAEPAGACVNCGYELPLLPRETSSAPPVQLPAWLVISAGFLSAGLVLGIVLAVLSSVTAIGGWLLVALGIGLVVVMGAFEAGYMDGPKRRIREYLRRSLPG